MDKKSLLELRKMTIEELVKYYAELRKKNYQNGNALKGINFRKKIYFLIKLILKIDQMLSKEEIIIINDLHNKKSKKPKIYACTHIGGNDIQRTFQTIKEPAYLMLGDPGILYKKLIYKGLQLNGVIPLETKDREDRKIAYNRAKELLEKGGNLLIYPEGAWNVSPNLLVMKLFTGTVRLAQETGAEIVPIAVEQYENVFYFNIGENYNISDEEQKDSKQLTLELRDKLVSLKWDIIQLQPKLNYELLPKDYLKIFQDEIVGRCNYGYGFSLQDALNESFQDKTVTDEIEAFSFFDNIEINNKNAFLIKEKKEYEKIKEQKKTIL